MARPWPLLVLAFLLAGALWPTPAPAYDCGSAEPRWSPNHPPIDLAHIFCGVRDERDSTLRGYHALAERRDAGEPEIRRRYAGPNADGVSRAVVCLPGQGLRQPCKCSSLFPDHWTVERVTAAVLNALESGRVDRRGFFRGPGGDGFVVEGWLVPRASARRRCGADRCVASAWPAYEEDATGKARPWACPLSR